MAKPLAAVRPRATAALVAAALGVCLAVSVLGRGILVRVAELYPDALPPNPYFVPEHALLLYVAMPVVVLATLAALLAPGILAVAAAGGSARTGDFAIRSFGYAYAIRVLAHSAVKLAGLPVDLAAFMVIDVVLDALLAAAALRRAGRGGIVWPTGDATQRRRLVWLLAVPALAAILMLPAIFWQDFNEDGLEALEIGRSLVTSMVPRFPNESGLMGLGIGMLAMAPAGHWFYVLMGPLEAAARLPLLLYLPVLFGVLIELVEWRSSATLRSATEAVMVLALAAYVVTMSYSASYSPYFADAAAPAAFESLTVLCIAATILFLWQGRTAWMIAFAVGGYLARPTGLLVLGLLGIAAYVAVPSDRRTMLKRLGLAIGACLVVFLIYEKLFIPLAAGGLGPGYPSSSILKRIQFLIFTDFGRVLFAVLPAGILPALALLAWRWQDPWSRQLSLFCGMYFVFFYPQAFLALHHFVPVMVLPPVVFWRTAPGLRRPWLLPAAAVAALAGLWASWPRSFRIDRTFRRLGQVTDYRVGDYHGSYQEFRAALAARTALDSLFRRDWQVDDPARELVGTATGLIYYAARSPHRGDAVNYVVLDSGIAAPAGFTWVAARRGAEVFVRDSARWHRDRFTPPPTDFRSRWYAIPRETMFSFLGIPERRYQFNLANLPGMWRVF